MWPVTVEGLNKGGSLPQGKMTHAGPSCSSRPCLGLCLQPWTYEEQCPCFQPVSLMTFEIIDKNSPFPPRPTRHIYRPPALWVISTEGHRPI